MADKIIIIGLIIVGLAGAYIGLGGLSDGGMFAGGPSLFASTLSTISEDFSSYTGRFLITFDNFKNVHSGILDENQEVKIFDIESHFASNRVFVATDRGLFLSRDGGLTWDGLPMYANEIESDSLVLQMLPLSSNGNEYLVSVFNNGVGTVYATHDSFFTLEEIVDFKGEAAYDIFRSGATLYLAMSNGQLISYDLNKNTARVVNVFSAPIIRIYTPSDGKIYLLLKSGVLMRATSFEGSFSRIRIGGGFLGFGSLGVLKLSWDEGGTLFAHTARGVFVSKNGSTFVRITNIPAQTDRVDAVAYHGGTLYVIVDRRMFSSNDGGASWHITDLPNTFRIFNVFFVGPEIILSM